LSRSSLRLISGIKHELLTNIYHTKTVFAHV
jgi:hypothetical protein